MAIQTKAELSASNNTAFPDNNSGLITPSILRGYNTASIDSFAALSGSNTFVGNQVITGERKVIELTAEEVAQAQANYAQWLAAQPTKEEQIAKLQEQIDALKA